MPICDPKLIEHFVDRRGTAPLLRQAIYQGMSCLEFGLKTPVRFHRKTRHAMPDVMEVTIDRLDQHTDTFLTLKDTAVDQRALMPFLSTYPSGKKFINKYHKTLSDKLHESGMIDIGIDGWLLPQDAQKLYEMAYHCRGDILELGTYRGLSASIMLRASRDAGFRAEIVSVDLDIVAAEQTRKNLEKMNGVDQVHLFTVEAGKAVKDLASAKRQFSFAFVDHSHAYEHVFDVCQNLHRVLELGKFALFHDFNDPRNADLLNKDYGVYQGVMDGLDPRRFEFWGIYGCCGLFRRVGPC
jgi:cephalosporin hydroxylase